MNRRQHTLTAADGVSESPEARDSPSSAGSLSPSGESDVEHKANTHTALLKACSVRGDVQGAEQVLQEMRRTGVEISHVCYNSIIHVCAKVGDARRAEEHLTDMLKSKVAPTIITYNTVINACAIQGDTVRAEYWFRCMHRSGKKPNAITYGTLCKAFAHKGDVAKVESIMADCAAAGRPLNEYFYASLLTACENATPRDRERAERVYEEMVKSKLNVQRVMKPLTRLLGEQRFEQLRRRKTAQTATAWSAESRHNDELLATGNAKMLSKSSPAPHKVPRPFQAEQTSGGVETIFEDVPSSDGGDSLTTTSMAAAWTRYASWATSASGPGQATTGSSGDSIPAAVHNGQSSDISPQRGFPSYTSLGNIKHHGNGTCSNQTHQVEARGMDNSTGPFDRGTLHELGGPFCEGPSPMRFSL